MKKLLFLSLAFVLISIASSAQAKYGDRFRRFKIEQGFRQGSLTRMERQQLYRNEFRYRIAKRKAGRDGIVTPFERKRLFQMKKNQRRQMFRYKNNPRRRLI